MTSLEFSRDKFRPPVEILEGVLLTKKEVNLGDFYDAGSSTS